MLAPSPSQHLESEIRPHGNPPYDSDIPNPALVVPSAENRSRKIKGIPPNWKTAKCTEHQKLFVAEAEQG